MGNTQQFEKMASRYDNSDRIHIAKLAADAIREILVDTKQKTAMDFGCGTGLIGLNLIDEFDSVLFVDTSANMLEQVNHKIKASNLQKAATLNLNLEEETPEQAKVDYIMMSQVLLHINDYQSVLTKLYDILNPSGQLIIIDYNWNEAVQSDLIHPGFDQVGLKSVLAKIGFRTIESKTIHSDNALLMGQTASLFRMNGQK